MKGLFEGRVVLVGLLHMLVAFTSIAVVTQIVGFNLPLAFLFAGLGTLVFHLVTKNKIPVTLGVSGVYIGSILFVAQTYGVAYAHGGIIVAGILYVLFALIMFKWQDKVLSIFPQWLLSMVVLLIGLSLLPIGAMLVSSNMFVGISALIVTALVDMLGGRRLGMFAMPLGVLAGTAVAFFTTGLNEVTTASAITYVAPMFALEPMIVIGLLAIPVMFEMMGDTKNTGDIIGKNVFKEVGVGRISLGNGLASIMGGLGGSNAYTTYSENTAFVMLSKFHNPKAQIWTAIFLIAVAFITPIPELISVIPIEAFGGVVTYLFALIGINAIKQIANSGVDLNKDQKVFAIMITMLAISVITITVGGITISSVAIATIVGVLLNTIFNK